MPKYINQKYGTLSHNEYKRMYRKIDFFLQKALENEDGFLTIQEIRKLLADETGIFFHPETLKKYNQKYIEKYGMGPLCRFKDTYKLNRCLYELKKIKPPKGHPKD